MQRWLSLALALPLVAAGCLGAPADEDLTPAGAAPEAVAMLPEDFEDSQLVPASLDPTSPQVTGPCEGPGTQCVEYPFTVLGNATLTADLTWTVPANDFDLFLFKGDKQVAASTDPAPQTTESLKADLAAGDYVLVVSPWATAADTFTIKATFGAP